MPGLPEIVRHDDGATGSFVYPGDDGEMLGELEYRWHDGTMVVAHTGVREVLRGQGAARKLVMAAVDAARAEGFLITPACPYARRVMDGDPAAFGDVRSDVTFD